MNYNEMSMIEIDLFHSSAISKELHDLMHARSGLACRLLEIEKEIKSIELDKETI